MDENEDIVLPDDVEIPEPDWADDDIPDEDFGTDEDVDFELLRD